MINISWQLNTACLFYVVSSRTNKNDHVERHFWQWSKHHPPYGHHERVLFPNQQANDLWTNGKRMDCTYPVSTNKTHNTQIWMYQSSENRISSMGNCLPVFVWWNTLKVSIMAAPKKFENLKCILQLHTPNFGPVRRWN